MWCCGSIAEKTKQSNKHQSVNHLCLWNQLNRNLVSLLKYLPMSLSNFTICKLIQVTMPNYNTDWQREGYSGHCDSSTSCFNAIGPNERGCDYRSIALSIGEYSFVLSTIGQNLAIEMFGCTGDSWLWVYMKSTYQIRYLDLDQLE